MDSASQLGLGLGLGLGFALHGLGLLLLASHLRKLALLGLDLTLYLPNQG